MDIISGLFVSGKLINDKLNSEVKKDCNMTPTYIKPINKNGKNIYYSTEFRDNFRKLHDIADKRYEESKNYKETGIIPNYLNKLEFMEKQGKLVRSQFDDINYETTNDMIYNQNRARFIYHNGKVMCNQVGGGGGPPSKQQSKQQLNQQSNQHKAKPKVKGKRMNINKDSMNKLNKLLKAEVNSSSVGSDSEFSDTEGSKEFKSIDSTVGKNHMELFNRTIGFNDKNKIVQKNKILKTNQHNQKGFKNQFDDMRYGSQSDSPDALNNYSDVIGDDFSKYQAGGNMTYSVVNSEEQKKHLNMVPQFKSYGAGYGTNNPVVEDQINYFKTRKVELFSGSANNLDYRPKTERKALFNPVVGLTHQFGMPNFTDYKEQYYIPSRYRNNEKPFQDQKVTPGLNLGYNEVNKGGIGETFRTFRPGVNDLRVASNPKTSYGPLPIIKNNQTPQNRPHVPNLKKRRPVTFWELDRPINGMGEIRAPKIEGDIYMPPTARSQTTTEWKGPAKFTQSQDLPLPEDMMEKIRPAQRQNYEYDRAGGGGAGNSQHEKQQGIDFYNWIPDATNRAIYNKTDRAGGGAVGLAEHNKSHAYDMTSNIPAPTLRNLTGNTDRVGNSLGNSQFEKSQAFDAYNAIPNTNMRNIHSAPDRAGGGAAGNTMYEKPIAWDYVNSIPETTMRNLTANADRVGNSLGTSQFEKSQAFDAYNAIPDANMRNVHSLPNRAGSGLAGTSQYAKQQAFDMFNAIPDANMRNIHASPNRAGSGLAGTSQYAKQQAFDFYNATPAPTMRNLTGNAERTGSGAAGSNQYAKGPAWDMVSNTPAPTQRDIINKTDRAGAGVAGNVQFERGHAFDVYNNIPDANERTIHNKYDRAGGGAAGNAQYERGKAFDFFSNIPDPTQRQMYEKADRAGHIGNSQYAKPQAFDEYTNRPDPTQRQMYEKTDRAGQIGNSQFTKPQAFDEFTNRPDITVREQTAKRDWIGPANRSERLKQMSRADVNNALLNNSKEEISKLRAPTKSNYTKAPTFEHTIVQLCNPLQINRELYPDVKQDVRTRAPVNITRHGNILPQQEWRFYSHVDDNIKDNPFINNIIHQSGVNM
jgi:hypothetical protein